MSTRLTAGDIAFTVTRRKNMRTIRLHVKPGGVVGVSCPLDVPDAELVALVEGRAGWIAAKRAELADTPRAHAEQASEEEKCAWKTLVEAAVPLLLEKWEPVMGVRARKLRVPQHEKPLGLVPACDGAYLHQHASCALPGGVPRVRGRPRAVPPARAEP